MRYLLKTLLLVTVFAGLSLPVYAQADNKDKPIDKGQAAQRAQSKVQGRVLKVDQSNSKYRVKVLQKSGRVVNVDVDKQSGKVTRKNDTDSNKKR